MLALVQQVAPQTAWGAAAWKLSFQVHHYLLLCDKITQSQRCCRTSYGLQSPLFSSHLFANHSLQLQTFSISSALNREPSGFHSQRIILPPISLGKSRLSLGGSQTLSQPQTRLPHCSLLPHCSGKAIPCLWFSPTPPTSCLLLPQGPRTLMDPVSPAASHLHCWFLLDHI